MSLPIRIRPQAQRDIEAALDYLRAENPALARAFLHELRACFERLAQFPNMGSVQLFDHAALREMRMFPLKRFARYLVFYRCERGDKSGEPLDELHIIRLLHAARDIPNLLLDELESNLGH